ncbi:propionate--coA ligase [Escherichia coli]|uniref:Propionate--coA ligase n=1 Tax=Escherichia coli TaxID=562 RepID=A0A2X3KEF1_ECOLX|nr:propionate--coA ligase [Escherichia coli]
MKDALKGQVAVAFVIPKESDSLEDRDVAHSQEKAIMALVDSQIGNFGRPRTSGLSRNCRKRDPEKCCAARSRQFAKDAILGI